MLRPADNQWSVEAPEDAVPLSFLSTAEKPAPATRHATPAAILTAHAKHNEQAVKDRRKNTAVEPTIENVLFEAGGSVTVTATAPRRNYLAAQQIPEVPEEGVETAYDLFQLTCSRFGDRRAFGQRSLVKMHTEEKEVTRIVGGKTETQTKKWTYPELSPYTWWTYNEARAFANDLASGLKQLGFSRGDKLSIFAPTSVYWTLLAHAAFMRGMTITTAYETLGAAGLAQSLAENSARGIVAHASLLGVVAAALPDAPTVDRLVVIGEADEAALAPLKTARPAIKVHLVDELRALGAATPVDHDAPARDDVACIMYTSGSTGTPKGVVIRHSTLMGAVAGVNPLLRLFLGDGPQVYMAYLPLAHILEFTVEMCLLALGIEIGFGSPRSLTDATVRNCRGDLPELRPTLMCGVPQVWETIRKNILAKLDSGPAAVRQLFWGAFRAREFCMRNGVPLVPSLVDHVIFRKAREATGGRLRFALSGGAAIHAETHRFLNAVLCPIIQGYGMTETCGTIAIQNPLLYRDLGSAGHPFLCTEFRLVSVPDTEYAVTNKPHPQGELWVRGANIMAEYYKQEAETAAAFSADGRWLRTGDIVELRPNGTISIIDRRKNLVKLANGEYIAVEKLEAVYKSSTLVQNLCVIASAHASQPIAVIVPVQRELARLVSSLGLSSRLAEPAHLHEAVGTKEIVNAIHRALVDLGRSNGFKTPELLAGIVLVDDEWTSDNEMLTPAQKLRRGHVAKHYSAQVEALFGSV